ncbi:sodium:solute symporter family protein [Thermocrinis jamiesonii]|uniref:sodium:solute symporter family protein n=1 Tax=Thermocrinis jamiesonii TaxID=1302351 RepID=UPI000494F013|nr:sodium:solute symporter family protein [Thermocrinis jamiesonii]
MIIVFVVLYMLFTLILGVYAGRLVKNSRDYILAGRNLPFYMATFVAFATWFGSETVLGASSVMAKEGLWGVVADPFGAALCLILVGLFFAKPLYRMNLLTFGDFYRIKYGRKAEIVASIMLIASYFGWIAAQMVAIGIILHITTGISQSFGIIIGSLIVLLYTFFGGMWAVSLTDFIQTVVIVLGLIFVLYEVSNGFSDVVPVVASQPPEYYKFFPSFSIEEILLFVSALITIGLGSIPQQDVFQRVMSSRSERVAVLSSITAGFMYLTVALIPLLLAIFARVKYPNLLDIDPQLMLPTMIMEHTSQITKVLFFGALLSAIMSTASSAILAPSAVLSENILRPIFKNLSDRGFLRLTRVSVIIVTLLSLAFAFGGESIFSLVESSSALSLVSLFVPMVGALYFKTSDQTSAVASMICGFFVWVVLEYVFHHQFALLAGLGASLLSFLLFSLRSKLRKS